MAVASLFCSASASSPCGSNSANPWLPPLILRTHNITYTTLTASSYTSRRNVKSLVASASTGASTSASLGRDADDAVVDLYEVLGVERSASPQEIRRSYRWLQKKCHPDIAGPVLGHTMSILLNHAYTTLSNPHQRAAYDQLHMESADLDGYTGVPLYSKWLGPTDEKRAVFVDESRCVGCLKCALIAPCTFAIETKFGRARAISQWADPQPIIEDAIQSCPVDCISWVDKSQLPVLEFAMSKVPRVSAGVEAHSSGGVRSADVFKEAERLLEKLKHKDLERNTSSNITETPAQRNARVAAMDEIQTRAGRWWYNYVIGKSANEEQVTSVFRRKAHAGAIVPSSFYRTPGSEDRGHNNSSTFEHNLRYIFDASKRFWSTRSGTGFPHEKESDEEYWVPVPVPVPVTVTGSTRSQDMSYVSGGGSSSSSSNSNISRDDADRSVQKRMSTKLVWTADVASWAQDLMSGMPVLMSGVAAWYVGVTDHTSGAAALSDTEIGIGPVPSEWMQSMEMHIVLTAIIWYLFGAMLGNTLVLVVNWFQGEEE